jgi:antitoxin component of MazEF toxin-antitoxin module
MYVQTSKIRKIGNSQGIIFPTEFLEALNLKSGSEIELTIDHGTIIITPKVPNLDQLLASVPKGKKFKEAQTGRSRGKEV